MRTASRAWDPYRTAAVLRMSAHLGARLAGAPERCGSVHSVFDRAVNLLCHDGRLLLLQGPGPLVAPFAASVDLETRALGGTPGSPVLRDGTRLTVGRAVLDWARAEPVPMAVRPGGDLAWFAASLAALRVPDGAAALRTAGAALACRRLADGIRRRDTESLLQGWHGLVGLGEGLTPAGDDCLVGVLAALWRFAADSVPLAEVHAAVADALGQQTTLVAREFVLHALGGWFAEPVLDLVHATSREGLTRGVTRLVALGATSGRDTLTGVRLATDALHGRTG